MSKSRQLLIGMLVVTSMTALSACEGSRPSVQGGVTRATTSRPAATPVTHTITGTISVTALQGIIFGIVSGNPDIDHTRLTMDQLNKEKAVLVGWKAGQTYECPLGAGGGFSDIVPGAQVTVRDGSGQIVGLGELSGGTFGRDGCMFNFAVVNLPDVDFYSVEVSHRGAISYAATDLESRSWTVAYRL